MIVAAIPAYNEEKSIAKVVLLARRYVDKVIVCDDGSDDLTASIAEGLGAQVIRHERNMGYGAAIQTLFKEAKRLNADVIVTLDADGQHEPSQIPILVEPILKGDADVVVGSRFLRGAGGVPSYRRFGIKVLTRLTSKASKGEFSDAQSGFRAYSSKAVQSMRLYEEGMGMSAEILLKAKEQGLRISEVPITCLYKGLETSTQSPLKHGVSVVMSIVRLVVEERPLVFLGIPGAVSLLIGLLFGVWMLQLYAIEQRIVTNVALASMAFILVGLFAIFTAITLYAIARLMQKASSMK